MAWTERQRGMLQAIGLRVWAQPGVAPVAAPVTPAAEAAVDARSDTHIHPATSAAAGAASARLAGATPQRPPPVQTAATAATAATTATAAVVAAGQRSTPLVQRPDIAQLDWPALRDVVSVCRACGLCESRTQTVFGVGHPQAHWMVVGEAPGEQEDRQGEPFVGPAGQLLDRMLAALQLTRASDGPQPPSQRAYIANTLKCRPPRNRNPAPEEMAQCEPYLVRQIELLQPRIILAMGAFAVKALLRTDQPVGKLRGQVHRYQGVPLVVTYHPAYLLRSLQDKAKAWEDLCLAAQVVEGQAGG